MTNLSGAETTTESLIAEALGPYSSRPDTIGLARLINDLITCGSDLHRQVSAIPKTDRTYRAIGALADWDYASAAGPRGTGDPAHWNHARGLARVIQNLIRALAAYSPASTL
ncbi:hypothetical protein ACFYYB_26220 [Streptomyces sp. NPDC002886]|uniref:hypothetical protein n=1 Tax=Streptomyces sp. NPDC002886 TaxID=3364667 RepID=UPI0036AA584F